jgi:hypothetical protein
MSGAEPQDDALSGLDSSTDYRIDRYPDVTTVTPGAEIAYSCQWIGPGGQPSVASQQYWGPRDGVHWYRYSAQPPRHFWQNQLKSMYAGFVWKYTWEDDPGFYSVIAVIRNRLAPGADPTRCSVSQQVGDTGAILRESLDHLLGKGALPSLPAVKAQTERYVALLQRIEKRFPISDPRLKDRHDHAVQSWREYAASLGALQKKTEGKRRILVRGLHIETATQVKRPLFLFLVDMGEVQHVQPRGGVITHKKWMLVDWTNAENPRFRGEFEGEGQTQKEAIENVLSNWDWSNRYPKGQVTYEIPSELRSILAGPARRRMDTNGMDLTEEVIDVLGWIAVGALIVSGVCAIFVAVPALSSAAFATALVSSTGGAVLSIVERRRTGVFDWQADVIDGLTIVSNIVGAGAWRRGARVTAFDKLGKKADYVFIGTRIGSDAVEGVLVAERYFEKLDAISQNPDYLPEERARESLKMLGELVALGMMTYFSCKVTGRALDHLETKPEHLADQQVASSEQLKSTKERVDTLVNRKGELDLTAPPISEGHTSKPQTAAGAKAKPGQHKTTANVAETHSQPSKTLDPRETDFAKLYARDERWTEHLISRTKITLIDKDGFEFHATCDGGTLEIYVNLADAKRTPPRSTVMKAKDLFPLMYDHFARVGERVERLSATWVLTNYEDAKTVYDDLVAQGKSDRDATYEAVRHARTYRDYHFPQGLTKLVRAERGIGWFHAEFEREE